MMAALILWLVWSNKSPFAVAAPDASGGSTVKPKENLAPGIQPDTSIPRFPVLPSPGSSGLATYPTINVEAV